MSKLNEGCMPNTDFTYEEFEGGLLARYYLTLLPLKEYGGEDEEDFSKAHGILNGFAQRHGVRLPKQAAQNPRPTRADWGQPAVLGSCFSILDMMGSFWCDFGVGYEPRTEDYEERKRLGRLIISVFLRHGIVTDAEFEEIKGEQVPVRIVSRNHVREFAPLIDCLKVDAKKGQLDLTSVEVLTLSFEETKVEGKDDEGLVYDATTAKEGDFLAYDIYSANAALTFGEGDGSVVITAEGLNGSYWKPSGFLLSGKSLGRLQVEVLALIFCSKNFRLLTDGSVDSADAAAD